MNIIEDMSRRHHESKGDISFSDQLADFEKLRISALTKAAEMSPLVKEVTIGPKSPIKKDQVKENKPDRNDERNLIEDSIREDLRYTLIMKEYEAKLQEASEEIFKNLIQNMIAKRHETVSKCWTRQAEECERRALELKARKMRLLKEIQNNDNLLVLEKAKLDEQQHQVTNKKTIEHMNRILEEQSRATARLAAITDSHSKVWICYNEITCLVQSEPLAKEVFDKYLPSINTIMQNISCIMDMCNTGSIADREVKQAEILTLNLDNIRKKIVEDLNELKEQEIRNKQIEEEASRKVLEEKKIEELKPVEISQVQTISNQTSKTRPMFYSPQNYEYYEELKNFLVSYEKQYEDLLNNVNLKTFRFDCQKAVNTPINALSSVSGTHMKDKFDKLSKLLRGERVQVLDTFVTATQHPQGLYYCKALLAKKIVRQGELLVSSNPEAAFPLAAVTVALWSQFPELGRLLEAYFHRVCPYLVPMFLPQKEGQTDKEFYMSRGYTYNDEGVVEKQDKFLKRMSGIFRLHCAIWIAKTPKFINVPNPHGLNYGWKWLASFVNLRPEPDISATLLHDFFSVCGSEFFKCYGKQFTKIIRVISIDYLTILENIDEGGPKTRLEVFLQNVLKSGFIPPPSGMLQVNAW